MLIPTSIGLGFTSVSLGIIHAIEQIGIRLSVFQPISKYNSSDNTLYKNITINKGYSSNIASEPLSMQYVKSLLSSNQQDVLMEELVARYYKSVKSAEVILIKGIELNNTCQFTHTLNYEIARTLNAEIILVLVIGKDQLKHLQEHIELACNNFGGRKNKNIIGVIINKLNAPIDEQGRLYSDLFKIFDDETKTDMDDLNSTQLVTNSSLPVIGCVPWNVDLIATRAIDIARHLKARVINEGDIMTRVVKSVNISVCSSAHVLKDLRPDLLLITSAHRPDILFTASLAAMNGMPICAILITDGYNLDQSIIKLCEPAFITGLPVFIVDTDLWQTSINLQNFNFSIVFDDYQRIDKIKNYIASYINTVWIRSLSTPSKRLRRLSPAVFRHELTERARQANKCIVLPEGEEPRIVQAAAICTERRIAKCILLGNTDKIQSVAKKQGIQLAKEIEILNPVIIRDKYVSRLLELRKSKGMSEIAAREQLEDNVMLGTLMLEQGEIDGLVSGVAHTTANTIRPSLQLIKTAPGHSLVSSVFFMLLPDQVLVYGDCAINPDPTAEQLSEIAIQSAESAAIFGIEPRVAMISYSTGNSGYGSDVEKVRQATNIAKNKRPDLIIDGPLQYDAAIMADIAKYKAPHSLVAGRATVFIFPDLNTGNTTYKAVQRSATLVSIGPMLQGMRKPVNDLSRGALINDIVYTVALTAIQSYQIDNTVMKIR